MNKGTFSAAFVFFLLSSPAPATEVLRHGPATDEPSTFFAIHCDPITGYNGDEISWDGWFQVLDDFIAYADSFGYRMTIQFTPQWVLGIMRDESKLNIVAGWAWEGHEIAAHHHGVYHQGMWDGFTNLAESDEKLQERLDNEEALIGSMDLYDCLYAALEERLEEQASKRYGEELAIDINTLSMNDTDQDWDWPSDFPFSTTGIFISDMISVPYGTIHNGVEVREVTHCSLAPPFNQIEDILSEAVEKGFRKVIGMNAHVNDFIQDGVREKIDIWFHFLYDNGGTVGPVSEIL